MIFVPGKNPLIEILNKEPKRVIKIYTSVQQRNQVVFDLIFQFDIPLITKSKEELSSLCPDVQHQGFVAELKDRNYLNLDLFLGQKKEQSIVVMLDGINDPHNFGAILRASECFGVDAVVWTTNRGGDITPVVVKSSAGASELIDLIKVSNLSQALDKFKKSNYWVVSTALNSDAESIYQFKFPKKTLIIFGSEGKGISNLLLKKSDFSVYLPMQGQIDSLNVSQAAACVLGQIRQQI